MLIVRNCGILCVIWKIVRKKEKSAKYGKLIILNVDGVIWIVDGMLCVRMWFMMMIWCEMW